MKNLTEVYTNLKYLNLEDRELLFKILPKSIRNNYYNIYEHECRIYNFIDDKFIFISENKAKELNLKEVSILEYIDIINKTDFSVKNIVKDPKAGFYFC